MHDSRGILIRDLISFDKSSVFLVGSIDFTQQYKYGCMYICL